jgi:hypothetical protein
MHTISTDKLSTMIDHVAFALREPLFIWGDFGVGKSKIVDGLCKKRKVPLIDIRLSQYESVDLRGLPVPDTSADLTRWLAPSTLPIVGNPRFDENEKAIVVFFDEMNAAVQGTSASAYQIINDRCIGEHPFMDNVIFLAAGNPTNNRGVTHRQPAPLSNRFVHVKIEATVDAWTNWAAEAGVDPQVIAFLNFRTSLLCTFDPKSADNVFATPRTWEKVSRFLQHKPFQHDDLSGILDASIAGAIGEGPGAEFAAFRNVWLQAMKLMKDIERNPGTADVPAKPDMRYAIAVYVSSKMNAANTDSLDTYLARMPAEMRVLAWRMALLRDQKVSSAKSFAKLIATHKSLMSI